MEKVEISPVSFVVVVVVVFAFFLDENSQLILN